jgi:hypothetical protein
MPTISWRRQAFTLIECLIATTLLAAAVVAIATALAVAHQQAAPRPTAALAEPLMEEIAARPFSRAGDQPPTSPTALATYDTIDDFDGYTDRTDAVPTSGGLRLDLTGGSGIVYARTVRIDANAAPVIAGAAAADFKAVTVTVSRPGVEPVSLTQVFARMSN